VRVSTLLEETGIKPNAKWILAEGADAAGMSRSVPLSKIMDDALIALYQNGDGCGQRTATRCGCCCPAPGQTPT